MGKTKGQRKAKKFRHNVNRKRLRDARQSTGKPADTVKIVKNEWDEKKSIMQNLTSMGLAFDPNQAVKIPTGKELVKPIVSESARDVELESESETETTPVREKGHVAEEVEKLAKAPREKGLKLPKGQVKFLTYLINKYGEDYTAMSRDYKNIYQETPNQLRRKIKIFKSIPSQWDAEKGIPKTRIIKKKDDGKPTRHKERKFGKKEVEWITYCLNRYGRHYEAMAKDLNNVFKDTPGQIRRLINRFKNSPSHWNAYKASNTPGVYLANKPETITA